MLHHGTHGEKYNVQGEIELDNLQIAEFVAQELGRELKYKMHDNPGTRPGHDLRYALDGEKLRALGWALPLTFWDSLRKTIRWMVQNPEWLDVQSFEGRQAEELGSGSGMVAPGAGVREVVQKKAAGGGHAAASVLARSKL